MRSSFLLSAALIAITPVCASARTAAPVPPVKLSKPNGYGLKGRIAVLSYALNFVTGQRASANATIGIKARAGASLIGVDDATMRRLANDAFADLKAQLSAAGIPLIDDATVAQTVRTAGVKLIAGNRDENRDGGITIGSGVKKAYVSVGADAAPLTDLYQSAGKVGGFGMLARFGKGNALSKPALQLGAAFISPSLIIDFADADARVGRTLAGGRRASVDIEPQFAIRAPSPTHIQVGQAVGIAAPAMMTLSKDAVIDAPFSSSAGASAMQSEGPYIDMKTAQPGDIVVDLPRWIALVESAYRAYNAAVAANLAAAR